MAEIVNLRQARKRKLRADRQSAADANRLAFGRTGSERKAAEAETALALRRLESHKRAEHRDVREHDDKGEP